MNIYLELRAISIRILERRKTFSSFFMRNIVSEITLRARYY